jgi:membrane protease YdiL (CAAX protease family)
MQFADATWAWITIPLVEEILFRGWVFNLLNRIYRNTFLNALPLFPAALWGQALAFSVWHLQNWGQLSMGFLIFQLVYTFFVGLWLGFYRWQTNRIWLGLVAHLLLNFFADWKLWIMLI